MQSEFIPYDNFIWNDKRNVSEVLNEKSGFFVNTLGLGMYNKIYFDNFRDNQIGFFKDGIQINNNFFGIFDPELISINEIEKIEIVSSISSFIYGMNSLGKAVNIITKDTFSAKPFSQLRYSQDRYGSLNAALSFTIPLSRKFNFLIRANNHSLDGKYANSDFSVWRANGRLSWYPTALWNFKIDFDYSKISRGVNNGLDYFDKDVSSDSAISIFRDTKAAVLDPTGREENRNYNVSFSAYSKSFGKNSLLSAQLYYNHYYRGFGGYGFFAGGSPRVDEYYYTEKLGLNLKYFKNIYSSGKQSLDLTLLNNYYLNSFNIDYQPNDSTRAVIMRNVNYGFLSGKIDYKYDRLTISALAKQEAGLRNTGNIYAASYGGELRYNLIKNADFGVGAFAGANRINSIDSYLYYPTFPAFNEYSYNIFEAGLELNTQNLKSSASYNNTRNNTSIDNVSSAKLNIDASVSKFNLKSETSFLVNNFVGTLPFFSKNDISFTDKLFKDKLDLKIGFNFKFISNFKEYKFTHFEGITMRHYWQISYGGSFEENHNLYGINNKFIADAYIGARIGRANINFTLANIFNNFYYDTFMFPADDRGGFLNAASRFTIVWDFIN